MTQLFYDHFDTPLGVMEIEASERAIKSIFFVEDPQTVVRNAVTELAKQQLGEYFAGKREIFDLPLDADGTEFQKRVWQALVDINYGRTCTYGDIAQRINNPKGMRAVGLANGKNPLTVVVPCHRVIGANGALTGYASGVERKAWLLKHEGALML